MHTRYVGVIGGADCDDAVSRIAREVGRLIAKEGWILVCGGMGGVMEAACRGAREEGGVTLGILPGMRREEGNAHLSYALPTGLGHIRNTLVVSGSDALIALGGSHGTLSETAFAGINRTPVVAISGVSLPEPAGIRLYRKTARTPKEAVQAVKKLLEAFD
ncbi:MAG TPA: TIGR00725 family protein [Spirochaetia bacterium]|nr:TIGR00725 family protein [Spirochaetia bacterium]